MHNSTCKVILSILCTLYIIGDSDVVRAQNTRLLHQPGKGLIWRYQGGGEPPAPTPWELPEYSSTFFWYHFTDSNTVITDYSTIGTNIATNVAAAWIASSNACKGYYKFAGSSNSLIQVPYSCFPESADFSMYGWYRIVAETDGALFSQYTNLVGNGRAIVTYSATDDAVEYYHGSDSGNTNAYSVIEGSVKPGIWHMFGISRSSGVVSTYRDGVLIDTESIANTNIQVVCAIGATFDNGLYDGIQRNLLNGEISEIGCWKNKALTATDFSSIYTNTYQSNGWAYSLAVLDRELWSNTVIEILGDYQYPADTSYTGTHSLLYPNDSTRPAWRSANTNAYWDFDGSTDYLKVVSDDFRLENCTWMWWMYLRDIDGTRYPVAYTKDTNSRIMFQVNAGDFNFYDDINNAGAQITITAAAIATGQWYHVAAVFVNSNKTFYINGIKQATVITTGGKLPDLAAGQELYLGGQTATADFNGYVDDARVFNSSLASNEVFGIYNNSKWKFGL